MKKLGSLAACLIFLCHLSAQNFGVLDDIAETEKARWAAGGQQRLRYRDLQNSADNRSDIRYCRLHWTVDPAVKYIRGEVMTLFEPTENLNSLDFDFSEALTMDSVVFHGQHLAFSRSGNIIQVAFPQSLPAAAPDSLTFFYQGVPDPDSTGFGSFELEQHAGTPVLWTLSEPYGAMEWWPCKQALNDKIEAVDIFITCPENYRAASNGLLQSETSANGWKTAHWQHRYPIPAYLICMAVTNYTTFSVPAPFGSGSTEILNYVYPESLDDAQIGVAQNVAHYQLFSELFGEYPFKDEKYGHAQFGYLGGMEHQTMTFVGGFGYELLAHELAHHWFGDKVTCGSWQDIWLNEGFATYLSGLCYERLLPQFWVPFKLDRIKKVVAQPDGSVWVEDTSTVSRVFNSRLSYAKGGMVLHMLRWVCGDSAFFAGVRNYVNDPTLSYGYARTADLKAHLEAASGKNLDEFFADWIYGQGHPAYTIHWNKESPNKVNITLSQTPSHPSVAFFEMPVPVQLKNDSRDTILVLQHTFSGQTFSATLDFSPTELVFDPEIWLISKDNLVVNTREPLQLRPMEILPNPAKGKFFVRLEATAYEKAALRLWASDGKLVWQQNLPLVPGPNETSIGVDLPAGRYLLRLEGDGWLAERAVILQ